MWKAESLRLFKVLQNMPVKTPALVVLKVWRKMPLETGASNGLICQEAPITAFFFIAMSRRMSQVSVCLGPVQRIR
jgi:hypothetical protein